MTGIACNARQLLLHRTGRWWWQGIVGLSGSTNRSRIMMRFAHAAAGQGWWGPISTTVCGKHRIGRGEAAWGCHDGL